MMSHHAQGGVRVDKYVKFLLDGGGGRGPKKYYFGCDF
jgi:hypothetical protein